MKKEAVKDFVYGGLLEFFKNPSHFAYYGGATYSNLTPEGIKSLETLLPMVASMMLQADKLEIENKAKELTLKALKD